MKISSTQMKIFVFAVLLFLTNSVFSQNQTIGLFKNSAASFNGYTLFAPMSYNKTYLIDNCGKLVHSWNSSYKPGLSVYMLANGNLLRTGTTNNSEFNSGGSGGIIEMIDPNSHVTWSYLISDTSQCQHHDVEYLPNGNVLIISWDSRTVADAISAGRDPSTLKNKLWSEKIIEVDPTTNKIVWEWYVWDHLVQSYDIGMENYGVVAEHPELININYISDVKRDWLHINGIDYNTELDQILLSVHEFSEVWIIDHSTTSEEAAGHTGGSSGKGGDLLFRWGNPEAYNKGTSVDKTLYSQHDARWIPDGYPGEGGIMVFNNGRSRPGNDYSSVDVFNPVRNGYNYEVDNEGVFLPDVISWQYKAEIPTYFFSNNISGAERLLNGNTLICEGGSGHFFEVDLAGNIVWDYINPISADGPLEQGTGVDGVWGSPWGGMNRIKNNVFRIKRYAPDYEGLQYYNLTPGDPIELNPIAYNCAYGDDTNTNNMTIPLLNTMVYPNPVDEYLYLNSGQNKSVCFTLYNSNGEVEFQENENIGMTKFNVSYLNAGLYFYKISDNYITISTGKLIIE